MYYRGSSDPEERWDEERRRREQIARRRHSGSLLETLIVLATIVFLAAAFAPKALRVLNYTRSTVATGAAVELQAALQRYAIDHGDYPQMHTYDDLVRVLGSYVTLPDDPAVNNWRFVSYYARAGDYTLTLQVGSGGSAVTVVVKPGGISHPLG